MNPDVITSTNGKHEIVTASDAEQAVETLLAYIGEDVHRNGLVDTPRRVVKALKEMTAGYTRDPKDILDVQFEQDAIEPYTGIVMLRDIPFSSMCEHHMLTFKGHASVAYIPQQGGRIVGLSKLARLVDIYAKRLQVQERMTAQVANALVSYLQPQAAACIIRADHSCMETRGICKSTGGMVTSELRGLFFTDQKAREELMMLLRG